MFKNFFLFKQTFSVLQKNKGILKMYKTHNVKANFFESLSASKQEIFVLIFSLEFKITNNDKLFLFR